MKKLILLVVFCCHAQILSVPFTTSGAAAGGGFTISAASNSQSGTGALTVTKTTTAGSALLLHGSTANGGGCTNNLIPLPSTASGAETIIPLPLSTGSPLMGATIVSGGALYTSPTCSVTGCGGSATCGVTLTGGVVTNVSISNGGSCAGAATINIGGATGSGANVVPSAYGLSDGAGTFCSSYWYAVNIPGTSSEVFTLSTSLSGQSFNALTVIEVHGAGASPLDVAVGIGGASATSVTLGAFNTGSAHEAVVCPARIEALTNTWTAGSPYTLITGGGDALPGGNNFIAAESNTYSSTQTGLTPSISSNNSAGWTLACVGFHN